MFLFSYSQIGFTSQKQWIKYCAKTFPDYTKYGVNRVGQPRQTELKMKKIVIENN